MIELKNSEIIDKVTMNNEIINKLTKMNSELMKMNSKFIEMNLGCGVNEEDRIEELRSLVKEYIHDNKNPELPKEPSGSLFGIGFIYDDDKDDRVLIAIDNIKYMKGIVAVWESEGVMNIYGNCVHELESIEIYWDTWTIQQFVFEEGEWVIGSGE